MKKWSVYSWMPVNGNWKKRQKFAIRMIAAETKAEARKTFLLLTNEAGRNISVRRVF